MRSVQYRILTLILNKISVPDYVYAFEKGKNIPLMAASHVNKGVVISLDLKDFFGSIKEHHLSSIFERIGIKGPAGRTLSELCTYKAFVPQGALTSPKLSNIVTTFTFGPSLKEYCDSKGLSLTVYADDITISSEEDIVAKAGYDAVYEIIRFVSRLVGNYGFRINTEKTKVMRNYQRQYVCGAVVNQKVNLQKTERNRLRAIVYNVTKNGVASEAEKSGTTESHFVNRLMGQLNWFCQLNPEAGSRLKSKLKEVIQEDTTPYAESGSVKETTSLDAETPSTEQTTTLLSDPV